MFVFFGGGEGGWCRYCAFPFFGNYREKKSFEAPESNMSPVKPYVRQKCLDRANQDLTTCSLKLKPTPPDLYASSFGQGHISEWIPNKHFQFPRDIVVAA